jgi:osmotically-inducible protein OsmY
MSKGWNSVARWTIAAIVGSAMTTIGCASPTAQPSRATHQSPVVADASLVPAFDSDLETRLVDRLELDHFLRDREIHVEVADGVVYVTGEVWTPLERERVDTLVRAVPGVIDVANHLDVQPPQ